MSSRGLVYAAVIAFLVAWSTIAIVASWSRRLDRPDSSATSRSPAGSALSRDEIARHDRPDDCWLVIRGKVYDVTPYIPSHPAPRRTITDYCGKESTHAFETKDRGRAHSPDAWRQLQTYFVGEALE